MKKTEMAMVALIAGTAVIISFFLMSFVVDNWLTILKVDEAGVKVKTTEKISSEVREPSKEVFNSDAINPTVKAVIGQ